MRKRKLPFDVLIENINYYNFCNYSITTKNNEKIKGTLYYCDYINRDELEKYNNVAFYKGRAEYAPEIKRNYIFVGNKCFK